MKNPTKISTQLPLKKLRFSNINSLGWIILPIFLTIQNLEYFKISFSNIYQISFFYFPFGKHLQCNVDAFDSVVGCDGIAFTKNFFIFINFDFFLICYGILSQRSGSYQKFLQFFQSNVFGQAFDINVCIDFGVVPFLFLFFCLFLCFFSIFFDFFYLIRS